MSGPGCWVLGVRGVPPTQHPAPKTQDRILSLIMVEPSEIVRPERPTEVPKTKQQALLTDASVSALWKYRLLIVGDLRWSAFLRYELLTMFLAGLGGSLGLWLRQKLYRFLFHRMGRGVAIGRYVTLRAPFRIALGDRVVLEDFVLLDGRGDSEELPNLLIGDDVFIGRGTHLVCRGGTIRIGAGANVGPNCLIQSVREVVLEDHVLLAPFVYIAGATRHYDRLDVPVIGQPTSSRGVRIGRGTWVGAHVFIDDGVRIGRDCIIGAGSVVLHDIPDYAVAYGVPARVARLRTPQGPGPARCRGLELSGEEHKDS